MSPTEPTAPPPPTPGPGPIGPGHEFCGGPRSEHDRCGRIPTLVCLRMAGHAMPHSDGFTEWWPRVAGEQPTTRPSGAAFPGVTAHELGPTTPQRPRAPWWQRITRGRP